MRIQAFEITRFQFPRDRVIGDSQVRADEVNVAALELIDDQGRKGLGFAQTLFVPLPALDEIVRVFTAEVWPSLEGQERTCRCARLSRAMAQPSFISMEPFDERIEVRWAGLRHPQAHR